MYELFDKVKLITNKYSIEGALKGDIGDIVEIYHIKNLPTGYHVAFTNPETGKDYALIIVLEEEIEKVK